MRYFLTFVMLASLLGCAQMERRKEAQNEARRELAAKREAQEKLGAGSTIDEVRYAWDEPDYEELKNGKVVWRYLNAGDPMAFEFTDGKLTGYYRDDALAAKNPKRCTSSVGWFGKTHTVCQ